jgi:glycosyltransferase involved in cell wall biosynthesis
VDSALTIAIPTYNRAALLDRQLGWLSRAVAGHQERCEVLISDNASTDETPRVVERWRQALANDGVTVRTYRNERNLGAIRNIAFCIGEARGRYVWAVSDDDTIDDGSVSYVLSQIDQHPGLAVLMLNFSSRMVTTGEVRFERCYAIEDDSVHDDGREIFLRCVEDDPGGVALTTALVYRADLARRAIRTWRRGLHNLVTQIYWTGYCAANGPTKVTRETHLECAAGTHFFVSDPRLSYKLDLGDTVELYARLAEIGYPADRCLTLATRQLAGAKRRLALGVVRWPATGMAALARVGASLASLSARAALARRHKPAGRMTQTGTAE